ncbi:MAG: RNA methyltransferase [Candidatus Gracilibacteria bacterium]|jgi:tRNA G18 (ribose-2'-O)-methylase SpoU
MAIKRQKTAKKTCTVDISVVLDSIRSLHNLGSIFRTCDGAGVSKVYLCGITGQPTDPKVAKTALGAEKTIPYEYKKHALTVVKDLKKQGYEVVSLELAKGSKRFDQVKYSPKTCFVIGNEVTGIRKSILKESDNVVFIPMYGEKESLNVSVAFGIGIYGIVNQAR